jgi:hypothetical protein
MNIYYNDLDSKIMKMLLEGDDPVLHTLRQQFDVASPIDRKMSGVGFFLTFHVPADAPRLSSSGSFTFGDVGGRLEDQQEDVVFLLHIKDGTINFLEGATYGNSWPEQANVINLSYIGRSQNNLSYIGGSQREMDNLPWRRGPGSIGTKIEK